MDPELHHGQGLGVAPIGHSVTVSTPSEVDIDVSATVTFNGNYTLDQLKPTITSELSNYIESLRRAWADEDNFNQYHCEVVIAKITSAIVTSTGVGNVTDVELNGEKQDIVLIESGVSQQTPKLNKITINGEVIFDVQTTA